MTSGATKRVLLKVSGEVFSGAGEHGIVKSELSRFADEVSAVSSESVELAIVVGGGNFLRGAALSDCGIDRVSGDFMGMLATILNGIALRSALSERGTDARVLSAIPAGGIVEAYAPHNCVEHLQRGRVVILVGGTGNPYFTTDTCATLRAVEIGATMLLKGTKVDGIYSDDPVTVPDAERFDRISYSTVLRDRLRVMDSTAIALSMDNGLPILVFNIFCPGHLRCALGEGGVGTLVCPDEG